MGDNKDDTIDIILEQLKYIVILVMSTIIDCLEESFDCMTYVGGKNLKWVLLVVFSFVPITAILPKVGMNTFVPWQDAVIAFIVMLFIYAINNISKASIDNSVLKAKEVVNNIKERRHRDNEG